jgi:hypothetical protein
MKSVYLFVIINLIFSNTFAFEKVLEINRFFSIARHGEFFIPDNDDSVISLKCMNEVFSGNGRFIRVEIARPKYKNSSILFFNDQTNIEFRNIQDCNNYLNNLKDGKSYTKSKPFKLILKHDDNTSQLMSAHISVL